MDQIDLKSYRKLYLQTAKEYVDIMLLSYTKLSKDTLDKEAINNLHISSHSLRSQSQVMEFIEIADISEKIEKMSSDALKDNIQLDNKIISDIKKKILKLEEILLRQPADQDDTRIKI